MPIDNGLSWKERFFLSNPIPKDRIIDLFLVKSPIHTLGGPTIARKDSETKIETHQESEVVEDNNEANHKTNETSNDMNNETNNETNEEANNQATQEVINEASMDEKDIKRDRRQDLEVDTGVKKKLNPTIQSILSQAPAISQFPPSPHPLYQNSSNQATQGGSQTSQQNNASFLAPHLNGNPPLCKRSNSFHDLNEIKQVKESIEENGEYFIIALCSTTPIDNSSFASIPRYFDSTTLNILSFDTSNFALVPVALDIPITVTVEKRISKCVVDSKHECIFIFLRTEEGILIYKLNPKEKQKSQLLSSKIDHTSPSYPSTQTAPNTENLNNSKSSTSHGDPYDMETIVSSNAYGTLYQIDILKNPNNFVEDASGATVPKIQLDAEDSWISWVGKTMGNGSVYGLVKCISTTSRRYQLDVRWISFNTTTYEIDFLNVKSNVALSEVFSYETEDLEPPTLVISNGEIFVLNLKHDEYESKIPRLDLSLMQWTNIPYRISHKYRRSQVQSKEEQKAIMSNSTAVAYIGFKYFIVLTRTRVFELFNSDWKVFSDLKELVHWKPFSDRPRMVATYKFQSILLLNRSMELFEIDITYVQKLLSHHSLEHNMALAFNHPKHTDMTFRIGRSVSLIGQKLRGSTEGQEFPASEPGIFMSDDDDYPLEIKAHSIVIKARAPQIFQQAVRVENNRYEVTLQDLRKSAVLYALKFVYTDQIDTSISKLNSRELWDLFTVCQKFGLDRLKERCLQIQNRKLYQSRRDKGLPSEFLRRRYMDEELPNALPTTSANRCPPYHDKFKNGNTEYFSQNYDRAISLYSETINDSVNFLVKVLIRRCAAYEKENKLELALADAEKALMLCDNDKVMKAKIKMRIGYIMNLMNKPLEGFICFCEAHELSPNTTGLFWDSSALHHAGHKLKLEGYPIPEKYRYMHTEVVSELGKSFQSLINNPEDSDFHFYFLKNNRIVYAHQFFVSMAGDFFRTLLHQHRSEVVSLTVDRIYPEATVEDILMLLEWIYTRKSAFIYSLPTDRLFSILVLSDFFGMYYIANEAQLQLIAKLRTDSISEVISYISASHRAGLRDVYNDLFDIISDRLDEVEQLDLSKINISTEIRDLIETSFMSVGKCSDLLRRSLSMDSQHRRSLSDDFENMGMLSPINTRTHLSQCSVRLFGQSYEDPIEGLYIVDAECSSWGSIWALRNLGTLDYLYRNPMENFVIRFELVIDRHHPHFTLQDIHYSCEIHRNVHSRNTLHPIFKLEVANQIITIRLGANQYNFPYVHSSGEEENSINQANDNDSHSRSSQGTRSRFDESILESVTVKFDKRSRMVSFKLSHRPLIQIEWPTSSYEVMTTGRRLFMSLSAKNERYYARYGVAEWMVDSTNAQSIDESPF